jgi:hypothetical protein
MALTARTVAIDGAAEGQAAAVARLVALGTTVVGDRVVPGLAWTRLADLEGTGSCLPAQE